MSTVSLSHYATTSIGSSETGHIMTTNSSRFTAVNGLDASNSAPKTNGDAAMSPKTDSWDRPLPKLSPKLPSISQWDHQSRQPVDRLDQPRDRFDRGRLPTDVTPARRSLSPDSRARDSPPKRRRSDSEERRLRSSGAPINSTEAVPSNNTNGSYGGERDLSGVLSKYLENHHGQENDVSSRSHLDEEAQRDNQSYETYRTDYSEDRRASTTSQVDVRHRDSMSIETGSEPRHEGMSEGEERYFTTQANDYGVVRKTGSQMDHRRRKRVFSNRTKTGCMTCRRRKKKCDELKPECNNCIRGGFVCEGYNNRVEWPKAPREKVPVPLQAKDGEDPTSSTQFSQPSTPVKGSHPAQTQNTRERSPNYKTKAPQSRASTGGGSTRPTVFDDGREGLRTAVRSSPANRPKDVDLWRDTPWLPTDYSRRAAERVPPPRADFSQSGQQTVHHDAPARNSGRNSSPLHSAKSSVDNRAPVYSQHSNSQDQDSPKQQTAEQQQAQMQAQQALQHHNAVQSLQPPSALRPEKEKMLAGDLYIPNSPELIFERDRCKAALWRFNNSMNPTLGISREERARLFRDVVMPPDLVSGRNSSSGSSLSAASNAPNNPRGRVGENVVVEAPFNCDYGYNISIGPDVLIGTNCTIMDTCAVTIGARCVIGPNVNILTATMPIDPRRRKGSQGPSLGRSVTIEEDCWIGAGVIILPGLKIGKAATVGAGSVVTRDVPRFTVVAGNPARVSRGIYENDPSMS